MRKTRERRNLEVSERQSEQFSVASDRRSFLAHRMASSTVARSDDFERGRRLSSRRGVAHIFQLTDPMIRAVVLLTAWWNVSQNQTEIGNCSSLSVGNTGAQSCHSVA